jgi:hypothetical protein
MAQTIVTGEQEVVNKLLRYLDRKIDKIADATQRTGIDVSNHAKSEHKGIEAHARNRYANVTNTLTNSINEQLVVMVGEVISVVSSNVDYAPDVEFGPENGIGYPFMYPAIRAKENVHRHRLMQALKNF